MKIIKLEIDEFDLDSGVDKISLVMSPAIEENFHYFNEQSFESYTDYPKQASENAQIALRWADENGWGSCGTPVGKQRANQLAKGEPISEETIARMAAFERHRQNSKKELGDGCGRLMWLAWGGDAGVEWAQRKLEQIRKEKQSKEFRVNPDCPDGYEHQMPDGTWMCGKLHNTETYTDEQIFEKILEDVVSNKYIDDLPEDRQDAILEQLLSVGESREDLEAQGWTIEEVGEKDFAISSKPDLSSLEDYGKFKIRYSYQGPLDSRNRTFCSKMRKANLIYRKEDINQLTIQGENSEFGIYDIFTYKGSYGCRHYWQVLKMFKNEEGMEVTQTEESISEATSVNAKPTLNRNPNSSTLVESNFSEHDKEKQMVVGPIMVPEKLIYRWDIYNGDYWVYFSKDTIEKIAHKYLINNYQSSVNIEHSEDEDVEDVTLVESWLVEDSEKDKSYAMMGKKYPKGTWFGTMKINNKKVWDEYIKQGKVMGWSVEGFFADKMINQSKQTFFYRTTEGGTEIVIDEVTSVVFILKDGERNVVMPDGSYELTNGKTLVVVDSKAEAGSF